MISPTITTKRLILRAMTQEDAKLAFSIWGDTEDGKYLSDPYYKSAEELKKLFCDIPEWSDYPYLAFERDTNVYVGTCSVGPEEREDEWEIGYCVVRDKRGQGYATEMAKAMIDFAYRYCVSSICFQNAFSLKKTNNHQLNKLQVKDILNKSRNIFLLLFSII